MLNNQSVRQLYSTYFTTVLCIYMVYTYKCLTIPMFHIIITYSVIHSTYLHVLYVHNGVMHTHTLIHVAMTYKRAYNIHYSLWDTNMCAYRLPTYAHKCVGVVARAGHNGINAPNNMR